MNELEKLLNDICPINTEEFDLNTAEGLNKFKIAANSIKEKANGYNTLFKLMFGSDLINIIDNMINAAEETYNNNVNKENDEKEIIQQKEIIMPSSYVDNKHKQQINKLVDEYIDTVISLYGKFDDKMIDNVKSGLFEFACWLINR